MAWADLTDVLGTTPPKQIPIHARMVDFPARISAWAGMTLLAIQRAAETGADAETTLERSGVTEDTATRLQNELLGSGAAVLDELGVIGDARNHVIQTLTVWHLHGEEAAARVWASPGKAPSPPKKKKGGRRSTKNGKAGATSAAAGGASCDAGAEQGTPSQPGLATIGP